MYFLKFRVVNINLTVFLSRSKTCFNLPSVCIDFLKDIISIELLSENKEKNACKLGKLSSA